MGYSGRLELKLQAQNLRREGKSYSDIISILHIPKSTVSDWCSYIQLSPVQKKVLYASKHTGGIKGSYIAAQNKKLRKYEDIQRLHLEGKNRVGIVSERDMFIAGLAFYDSEGTKSDNGCCFTNSDPAAILFMIRWFSACWKVPQNKFRASIWLHENLDPSVAIDYWSLKTGIPKDNFYKTYIAKNKTESKKIRKKLHNYGILSIYIHDTALYRQIMGAVGRILEMP